MSAEGYGISMDRDSVSSNRLSLHTSLFTVNGSKSKKKMKKYTENKLFTTYQFSITHSGDY